MNCIVNWRDGEEGGSVHWALAFNAKCIRPELGDEIAFGEVT